MHWFGNIIDKMESFQMPAPEMRWVSYILESHGLAFTYAQPSGFRRWKEYQCYPKVESAAKPYMPFIRQWRNGKGKRRLFLCPDEEYKEFDPAYDPALPSPPQLWNAVHIHDGLVIIVSVWRGDAPFSTPPCNDEETLSVIRTCCEKGGVDTEAVERWAARVAEIVRAVQWARQHYGY